MFEGARRRLVASYVAVVAVTLLLLGPVLYLAFSRQLSDASDVALRLAAQRQAALALVSNANGFTFGINPHLQLPATLNDRDTLYLLLAPDGSVNENLSHVTHAGLPDRVAAQRASAQGYGVYSTLHTRDAGDIRLYTAVITRKGGVVALLQAGRTLAPLAVAQHSLLVFLLTLGAGAIVVTGLGGLWLTREAMRPVGAAFAAQRNFVADASHELRTPLTLIRTNAEVLLETGAVPEPDDRALLDDIVAEAEHMGRLVADLLTLARLDAGVLPLTQAPVALHEIVASCVRQMARLAERKGIHVAAGQMTPVTVRGDASRLEQVVLIVLDNAVKYNHEGGTVDVAVRREGRQAVVEVRDSGLGIPPDELPRLFSRFHRGKAAGTRAEGSGLGLAIAQGIARAHGGRLSAASTHGQGSTLTLTVPLIGLTTAQPDRALTP